MSIGAISPVSPVRPREGTADGQGHHAERPIDEGEHVSEHRHPRQRDREEKPPPKDAARPRVDRLA